MEYQHNLVTKLSGSVIAFKYKTILLVVLSLVLGITLRTWGIEFPITIGPDQEPTVARSLMHVNGQWNPEFYRYPSFLSYSLAPIFRIISIVWGLKVPQDMAMLREVSTVNFPIIYDSAFAEIIEPYVLSGRIVVSLFAVGTIILMYFIGKNLYGKSTGFLAAILLAITPLHILDSHFVTVDVPATFFVVLTCLLTWIAYQRKELVWFALAGGAAGLAAGTKYPAGLSIVFPFVALNFVLEDKRRDHDIDPKVAKSILYLGVLITVFILLIAAYFYLFKEKILLFLVSQTISDVLPEKINTLVTIAPIVLASIGIVSFVLTWAYSQNEYRSISIYMDEISLKYIVIIVFSAAMMFLLVYPFAILEFRGFLSALYGEFVHSAVGHYGFDTEPLGFLYTRGVYFLLAGLTFSMGLLLYIASLLGVAKAIMQRIRSDWLILSFLTVYYLIIGTGRVVFLRYLLPIIPFLVLLAARFLLSEIKIKARWRRIAGIAGMLLVILYTSLFSISITTGFKDDTRFVAGRELNKLLPNGTSIAMTRFRNYYPTFDESKFEIVWCPEGTYDPIALVNCKADIIVLTSMLSNRAIRDPQSNSLAASGFQDIRDGKTVYEHLKTYDHIYLNESFYSSLDPMFEGYYVSPKIEVFVRSDVNRLVEIPKAVSHPNHW